MDIDVLGSYNTLKATIPELVKPAANTKTPSKSPSHLSLPPLPHFPSTSTPQTNIDAKLIPASPSPLGGRIIFISATMHYTGAPLQTHVVVAKAGVDALSANVALEFGPRGITSNVIAPGPIGGTEGMERLARKEDIEGMGRRIPSGRWGTVREIADATVYLFSEAAGYVNGTVLVGESFSLLSLLGFRFCVLLKFGRRPRFSFRIVDLFRISIIDFLGLGGFLVRGLPLPLLPIILRTTHPRTQY